MAKAAKESKIILELTEEEADFISCVTQNALVDNENPETAIIRKAIFNALAGFSDTYHGSSS